jgi:hypothetical protein
MTNANQPSPEPPADGAAPVDESESLVAYLDGEVDEASSEAVEMEMARNPKVRGEIDSLQRAWDLLDYLDRPAAKQDFTSRTLELATREIPDEPAAAVPRKPWPGPWTWRIGLVSLLLLGAGLVWWRPMLDRRIERNMPILDKLDVYRATRDVEFLRELEKQNLLDQMDHLLEPES